MTASASILFSRSPAVVLHHLAHLSIQPHRAQAHAGGLSSSSAVRQVVNLFGPPAPRCGPALAALRLLAIAQTVADTRRRLRVAPEAGSCTTFSRMPCFIRPMVLNVGGTVGESTAPASASWSSAPAAAWRLGEGRRRRRRRPVGEVDGAWARSSGCTRLRCSSASSIQRRELLHEGGTGLAYALQCGRCSSARYVYHRESACVRRSRSAPTRSDSTTLTESAMTSMATSGIDHRARVCFHQFSPIVFSASFIVVVVGDGVRAEPQYSIHTSIEICCCTISSNLWLIASGVPVTSYVLVHL